MQHTDFKSVYCPLQPASISPAFPFSPACFTARHDKQALCLIFILKHDRLYDVTKMSSLSYTSIPYQNPTSQPRSRYSGQR